MVAAIGADSRLRVPDRGLSGALRMMVSQGGLQVQGDEADTWIMTDHARHPTESADRAVFVAMVACCAVPMAIIMVLTSIVGLALGSAAGVALGLVAAGLCITVMVHHRGHHTSVAPEASERT